MKRIFALACLTLLVALPAGAQPNPASSAFARAANSPAGRALLDVDVDVTAAAESWSPQGADIVPFYYEQGMASSSDGASLVFSSRNSLTRTDAGCAAWDDPAAPCYTASEENLTPIPADLVRRGFNHIGGIDIGPSGTGPGSDVVFAPLETEPSMRSVRAYGAYDRISLARVGLLVEEVTHRYNSWVAVDPSARFMIIGEDRWEPLRVYEISRAGAAISLTRRSDLDVVAVNPGAFANFQGCKFAGSLTLYCANWNKRSSYFDVRTEIHRIDLSSAIGTTGSRATSTLAFTFKAHGVAEAFTANTPYGLETEDLAFWGGQLHVQVRGEALGWVRILHFAPTAS